MSKPSSPPTTLRSSPDYPATLNRRQAMRHVKENGDLSNWMTCSVILFGALMVTAVILAI